MKIALQFSGQPRNLRECYPFIHKAILEGNDVDVYAHLWWDNTYKNQIIRFHTTHKFENEDLGALFQEIYQPKSILIEPQKDFDLSEFDLENNFIDEEHRRLFTAKVLFCSLSMWYSVSEAHRLMVESGIKYDLVIRGRTDLIFMYPINFKELNPDILYISDSYYGQQTPGDYTDWFAIGGPERMGDYVKLYEEYSKYNKHGLIHMRHFVQNSLSHRQVPHKIKEFGCRLWRDYGPEKPMGTYKSDLQEGNLEQWPYFAKNIVQQIK